MAWKVEQLDDRILRLMRPADRKLFGKAGMTREEAIRKAEIKSERDLQKQLANYLRLHGIEPIVSRMDKATTNNVGTPDLLFAVEIDIGQMFEQPDLAKSTIAVAWEAKLPKEFGGKDPTEAQKSMAAAMTKRPNAWRHRVIRSLDEAIGDLRSMGFKTGPALG